MQEYFLLLIYIIIWGFILYAFVTALTNLLLWPKIKTSAGPITNSVSVLIPARNEEKTIAECLESVAQESSVKEILVYNDHSVDQTVELVAEKQNKYPRIRLIHPTPLREGWTGKNHACAELAGSADSDWLLFLDADTRMRTKGIDDITATAIQREATFISCWPGLKLCSFWEKLLMPMLNFFVYSVYPASLSFIRNSPSLGIAHGSCILIRKDVYHRLGGHSRVKGELFEDTQLARLWRKEGELSLCFDGQDIVQVRMYESLKDIWSGFQKNFFPGFKTQTSFFVFILLHTIIFFLPFFIGIIELARGEYLTTMQTTAIMVYLIRLLLTIRFRHPVISALLHPIAEGFLIALGISSWINYKFRKGVEWKGRMYRSR